MASLAFPNLARKATLSDGTTYGYVHVPAAPSKPTFLLLHGAPCSSYIWRYQIEQLPKAGFGVIAPDLLGYEDTDRPESYEPYQMEYMVPQVHELVSKVIGIDKVIGVGHDFGSPLLSHVYVRYKDLFRGLIFIAVGFTIFESRLDIKSLVAFSKKMVGHSTSGYMEVFISPEGASLLEKHDRALDSLLYARDPETWKDHLGAEGGLLKFLEAGKELPIADWISPEELEMHNRIVKGGYTGVSNWYKALAFTDPAGDRELTAEAKKVTVPTLLMVTEKDYVVMNDLQVQATGAMAQDLKVVRLDTGHWAMLEAKDEVEKLLEEFATARCS
ncbi:Epoxide hydrolase [Madurella fahalii]|uniref:Epoxide hydrolase n=1 Tax=Madurella fahalii TaxID=1157608 RepID=A0ABQ0GHC0_9PEZI